MSLREKFKKVKRKEPLKHYVEEIGDHVYIVQKTVGEQNQFESAVSKITKGKLQRALDVVRQQMLIHFCVDETGRPIWPADAADEIAEFPIPMVDGIVAKISEHNKYSDEDIEEMAKNVGATAAGETS